MMRRIFVLASLLAVSAAWSQDLVAYRALSTLSATTAKTRFEKTFGELLPGEISPPDIQLYKTTYRARVPHGQPVLLSGLVALPRGGAPKGLIVYFHGTTADRNNVPSRFCPEAETAILAFATAGYAVAAPDYLGLGDHNGIHPYPLGSVNCWSGIDLIKPARALAAKVGAFVGPKLFVTGYSEGGGVAMWAVRELDKMRDDPQLQVTSAAPLSGPYDLSGVQATAMLEAQSNVVWFGARVYFAAYVAQGMRKSAIPIDLEDYFTPSFASYIPFVFDQELPDNQTIQKLVTKALQLGAFSNLNRVLTFRFRTALKTVDVSDPLVAVLKANDCCDWKPQTPMYLVCIEDDFVVTKKNTLKAIECMRKLGVSADTVAYYIIGGRRYDHLKGAIPALLLARRYFDGGLNAVPTTSDATP